jgi:hypothetical protein
LIQTCKELSAPDVILFQLDFSFRRKEFRFGLKLLAAKPGGK